MRPGPPDTIEDDAALETWKKENMFENKSF